MSRERPHRPKNMGEVLESFAAAIQDEQKRGLPRFSQEQVKRIEAVVHHLAPEQAPTKRAARPPRPQRPETPRGPAQPSSSPRPSASSSAQPSSPPRPSTQSTTEPSAPPPSEQAPASRSSAPTKPAQDVKHVASVSPASESASPSPSDVSEEQLPWMIDESAAASSASAASSSSARQGRTRGAASKAGAVRGTQPPQQARSNAPVSSNQAPPHAARSTTSAAVASPQNSAARLQEIRAEMGDCRRCGLCETRTNIVFGNGNPDARLFLIGEAPSRQDDESGRIFSDEAGALLSDMLKAMTLSKDEVYTTTILKCRPPNNRAGAREELASCAPFLRQQIEAVQPDVILTLGSQASRLLLGGRFPFAQNRGEWNEWEGIAVMPTLHPGYLLRHPQEKASAWQDLQKVMRRMGLK